MGAPCLPLSASADFVKVVEQVCRIFVNPIGSCALQFLHAVATRQESDSQRTGALRGQHVPHAVADYGRLLDGDAETRGGCQKQIRIGFRVIHEVARDDWHAIERNA